jgi:hypothetical protein
VIIDVKYDLRHKARLVAGDNWRVNHKEHIYSSEMHYNTEDKKCMHHLALDLKDVQNPNILIIDKCLYGSKTSDDRFYEHLSESLLRIGFKKTKHDTDLEMVNKSFHYKYLAT